MVPSDRARIDSGLIIDKVLAKSAAYTMTGRESAVSVTAATADVVITLPKPALIQGETQTVSALSIGEGFAVLVNDHKGAQVARITIPLASVTFLSNGNSYEKITNLPEDSNRTIVDDFKSAIVTSKKLGGAATGAAGDENVMFTGKNILEWHVLGTQTILAPKAAAGGLDINQDQADDDGIEVCSSIISGGKGSFVVGTDGPFYARVRFSIADVSGTDDCAIGFRKVEAYQANIDDYDELASLNVISGNITIETILNAAATTTTDTTDDWADLATHTLEVLVSAAGVVTYLIDGVAPTVTAAFTFDDAEEVVPFIYLLNTSDFAGAVTIKELEVGFQK